MDYKLPGRYNFYSTIINACFEYLREINNEDIMNKQDNCCIVVSGDGSTIKSKDMFNATVDYSHCHVYMYNIRREDVRTTSTLFRSRHRRCQNIVRVLPTQLLAHATQQTRTMCAYVYQCTKLRSPKQIWFTYVRSGIAASILVEIRLRLDLGSAWSVWRYSNAQVRSLTARELNLAV